MSGRCWTGMLLFFSSFPAHMPSLDLMTLMPTFHPCGVCLAMIRTNKVRECRPSPAKRYNTIILLSLKLWNIIHNFPFLECEWAASAPGCDQNTSGFPQFLSKELLGYCFPGTWDMTYLLDIPSRSFDRPCPWLYAHVRGKGIPRLPSSLVTYPHKYPHQISKSYPGFGRSNHPILMVESKFQVFKSPF